MTRTSTTRPTRAPWILAAVAALALFLVGCGAAGPAQDAAPTRPFAADNGQIAIPVAPQRVVATGYAVPALIEARAPLVGISTWNRGVAAMPPQERATYDGLTKVAGESAASTNYEQIAQLRPDLIVIGVPRPVLADVDLARLQAVAPVVAIGPSIPSAWRDFTRAQADAAGVLAGFDQVKGQYEAQAAALRQKYAGVLPGLRFGAVGGYGQAAAGTFQREFNGSWGTNIANDIGVNYYGAVKVPGEGSRAVSEYPSLEEIPASLGQADVITYSLNADGSTPESVRRVLESPLFAQLPAAQANRVFALRFTEASTYQGAQQALASIDGSLAPLLATPTP